MPTIGTRSWIRSVIAALVLAILAALAVTGRIAAPAADIPTRRRFPPADQPAQYPSDRLYHLQHLRPAPAFHLRPPPRPALPPPPRPPSRGCPAGARPASPGPGPGAGPRRGCGPPATAPPRSRGPSASSATAATAGTECRWTPAGRDRAPTARRAPSAG